MTARFTLSAFGDETAEDVDEQLTVLNELDIRYLELRSAWGTNVLELTDARVGRLVGLCEAHSIAISCVGRRLVLGDRTDDELEAVLEALPAGTKLSGFYSSGELSPFLAHSSAVALGMQRRRLEMLRMPKRFSGDSSSIFFN